MAILGVSKEEFSDFKNKATSAINELKETLITRTTNIEKKLEISTKNLQTKISERVTVSEEDALAAAKRVLEIENQTLSKASIIESALNEIENYKTISSSEADEARLITKQLKEILSSYHLVVAESEKTQEDIVSKNKNLDSEITLALEKILKIEQFLSKSEIIEHQTASISDAHLKSDKLSKDINSVLENAIRKRSDIEDLHSKIFGREITKEDGSTYKESGLIDELDGAYDDVLEKISLLESTAEEEKSKIQTNYNISLDDTLVKFKALLAGSKERYNTIDSELKSLLPGSMAAGLSAAYEAKTKSESEEQDKHSNNFRKAIYLMIAGALIPFAVDAYLLLSTDMNIMQVITNTPNIVMTMIPLYLPILWLAYSSSKKSNLSKRLIEEYTHKAVLGKTFSGLSTQIENLPSEAAVKNELRTNLLFSILQVSAENPGKLITDYNKTDHPLMDALEKSAKLSDAVESLSKIPGFTALANRLADRSEKIFTEQAKKVQDGLYTQADLLSNDVTDTKPQI